MFNNLNNQNPAKPPVDDIFAETDKAPETGSTPGSEIETRNVGLTSTNEVFEEPIEKKGLGKKFKIILILIVATILILSGYLVYSKFFKVAAPTETITPKTTTPNVDTSKKENTNSKAPAASSSSVVVPKSEMATTTLEITETIASSTESNASTSITLAPVDSDSDGLADAEELLVRTNPNVIDTDNDGLSDYEEVKIYKTNPLIADTDGDSYLDGAEVKSGYNPNGSGKMPGVK